MKQKGFAPILLLVLFVILVIGFLYLGINQNKIFPQPTKVSISPIPTRSQLPAPSPTTTWKTYATSDGLISFNNPGMWELSEYLGIGAMLKPTGNVKEIDVLAIKESPINGQTLDSWYQDLTQTPYDGAASIISREKTKLFGYDALKLTETFEGVNFTKLYLWRGSWVFSFTVYPTEQFNSSMVQNFLKSIRIK